MPSIPIASFIILQANLHLKTIPPLYPTMLFIKIPILFQLKQIFISFHPYAYAHFHIAKYRIKHCSGTHACSHKQITAIRAHLSHTHSPTYLHIHPHNHIKVIKKKTTALCSTFQNVDVRKLLLSLMPPARAVARLLLR